MNLSGLLKDDVRWLTDTDEVEWFTEERREPDFQRMKSSGLLKKTAYRRRTKSIGLLKMM
jgi:hypothetical protein